MSKISQLTDDQIIALVQAHKDGKTIQFKTIDGTWVDEAHVSYGLGWDFRSFDYRVNPEPPKPQEFWICYDKGNNSVPNSFPLLHDCKQDLTGCSHRAQIHVREVIE